MIERKGHWDIESCTPCSCIRPITVLQADAKIV
jgi:hypothetical protein